MPSLLEALETKYGGGSIASNTTPIDGTERLVSIYIPKIPPLKCVPELLVLNDCNIDCAGEAKQIREKCNYVKELDLAQNNLQNWSEIFEILTSMPKIEFVNLSKNLLNTVPISPPPDALTSLKNVVLNATKLNWNGVKTLLKYLPVLEELHLSLNNYAYVLIDTTDDQTMGADGNRNILDTDNSSDPALENRDSSLIQTIKSHLCVKKLHFTGNPVSSWNEICRLGRVFPNLETLVLAECPLRAIGATGSGYVQNENTNIETPHIDFKNLVLLNLNKANITSWEDIDRLSQFPSLQNLRVQNWPLWHVFDATEHERRQLLIARLPGVEILNGGGIISAQEREDAERAFIRHYMDRPEKERPSRYSHLVSIHGKLDPLVQIDLRPEKRVKIIFKFGESSEIRSVDVYRTIIDLKGRLESLVGIPANKMRLYYVDKDLKDLQGPEEMKYPNKQLYSYNMTSGDEIIVDKRN